LGNLKVAVHFQIGICDKFVTMPEKLHHPDKFRFTERADLDDIIARPPGWTLRWGLTALLIGFAMLLAVSWFIRYPDVVEARAVLTTENPPIRLTAGASARVNKLLIKNGEQVMAGDLLAMLENPARPDDVLELENFTGNLEANLSGFPTNLLSISLPVGLQLGSLQEPYSRVTFNTTSNGTSTI
jgi:hypothetical protein